MTLEEFDASIAEPIEVRFAPQIETPPALHLRRNSRSAGRDDDAEARHIGGALDEDAPDPLIGGAIDLGAIASEFLTLSLDPYPRKPGAIFTEPTPDEGDAHRLALREASQRVENERPIGRSLTIRTGFLLRRRPANGKCCG